MDAGYRIVCGGKGGVMAAAARGAHRSARATGSDVVGILPSTDGHDANPDVDVVIATGLGHARNVLVVASADVVVAVGGRSGTLSELALAWTLGKPVVALTAGGGWGERLAHRAVDDRREDVVVGADSVEQALAAVAAALGR